MTDMEQKYDPNEVGKRMPYKVPDGFFNTMEDAVMQEITPANTQPHRQSRLIHWLGRASVAAAAALALVVGYKVFLSPKPVDSFVAVEQAFDGLSEEDRDYLIEVYREDVFMDEDNGYSE